MTAIDRNGISGLVLRGVVITLASVMFGCVPKAPPAEAGAPPIHLSAQPLH
jgi:hypothetical protein